MKASAARIRWRTASVMTSPSTSMPSRTSMPNAEMTGNTSSLIHRSRGLKPNPTNTLITASGGATCRLVQLTLHVTDAGGKLGQALSERFVGTILENAAQVVDGADSFGEGVDHSVSLLQPDGGGRVLGSGGDRIELLGDGSQRRGAAADALDRAGHHVDAQLARGRARQLVEREDLVGIGKRFP